MGKSWHQGLDYFTVILMSAFIFHVTDADRSVKNVIALSEKNWSDILQGEWLVEL